MKKFPPLSMHGTFLWFTAKRPKTHVLNKTSKANCTIDINLNLAVKGLLRNSFVTADCLTHLSCQGSVANKILRTFDNCSIILMKFSQQMLVGRFK